MTAVTRHTDDSGVPPGDSLGVLAGALPGDLPDGLHRWGSFAGLVRKESVQVFRDPSALLIAFVLPVVLLFLFAYAVSLDVKRVPFGVVLEADGAPAHDLAAAYLATPYFNARIVRDRREIEPALLAGDIRGFVVIPADFEQRMFYQTGIGVIQIITDASQPNTANFTAGYAQGVFDTWFAGRNNDSLQTAGSVRLEPRFWFNPEIDSRRVLLPGALAIIMTMIGTLLTALVVAREWERGTMEALMSTPVSMMQILGAKLVPYFVLGLVTTIACTVLCMVLFDLPMRGSPFAFLLLSAVFLVPALGQGLLISALAKNQFIAAQLALLTGFLPAFLLSGFLFEIASMPLPIRWLTTVVSARWYVDGLQTVFLAGDVWPLLLVDMSVLLAIGTVFVGVAVMRSGSTLD